MFKYLIHIITGTFVLMVSTLVAWYEGSTITNISWEWKYSTPFSNLFNIEIINGQDISQLDYFVYAVKFQPFFPALMFISLLYMIGVIILYLIKTKSKWTALISGFIGVCLLVLGSISNPSTNGGWIFLWISLSSGMIYTIIAVWVTIYRLRHGELAK
ncbi:YjdJ family protein [Lysinibacillus fusiformis]|nr:YjdJ family protein [Lysinibacillus fusiformis]